ncbi:ABC transporter related [Alkaliphilus metalliredigens QYMF]|uniref:ABC transporter related n=1 Tax=Alkaliphilus metalliredigens (strain QYMF) TaxID=293826 RepID=A6TP98_ALKMQ|nr:ABC transporter ATP-binding protein [Alkaliphilus metalliredigens]ABR48016.1 ABC transporter related [Alkaliphilus metalliredigens QYMF]
MNIVEFKDVTKIYGRKKAIEEFSFSLGENKITGIIGRNGAGKTTLLKLLSGFLVTNSGQIRVFEEDPFNSLLVSSNMIFVDDSMSFNPKLTLLEILESANHFYEKYDMKFALDLMEYFSLSREQLHRNLSKGMQSTFNMILGIASRSPLTILDEPTTGMDAAVRKDFYRLVLKDYINHPRNIVISSHLLGEVEHILEDILLLKEGKKLLHMPVSDLKNYGMGLRGEKKLMLEFIKSQQVYHKEDFGDQDLFAVVKNDFEKKTLESIKSQGIEIIPLSTNDICVHITNTKRGDIDDILSKNQFTGYNKKANQ